MGALYGNDYFFATSFSHFIDIYVPLCREFATFPYHIVQIDLGSKERKRGQFVVGAWPLRRKTQNKKFLITYRESNQTRFLSVGQ